MTQVETLTAQRNNLLQTVAQLMDEIAELHGRLQSIQKESNASDPIHLGSESNQPRT